MPAYELTDEFVAKIKKIAERASPFDAPGFSVYDLDCDLEDVFYNGVYAEEIRSARNLLDEIGVEYTTPGD